MVANMLGTFTLVMFTLLVFKANSLTQVIDYFVHIFSLTAFYIPVVSNIQTAITIVVFCCFTILIEWFQRDKDHALQFTPTASLYKYYVRGSFVMIIFWSIILWGASGNKTFMYFQF
jgi:alginate O-acetyltransferase complex protein AlgI